MTEAEERELRTLRALLSHADVLFAFALDQWPGDKSKLGNAIEGYRELRNGSVKP